MRSISFILLAFILASLAGCSKSSDPPIPENAPMPYFNQVNTTFETDQIQCLLDQWYSGTYRNEPIVLRVINDATTYKSFFSCKPGVDLPIINFTYFSLIVGMKAALAESNTPVNIKKMKQRLVPMSDGQYVLKVTVAGKKSDSSKGGEWFAFTSVVPKIEGKVDLEMKYEFE
ncbi:MAG: hypothetical protein ABIN80_14930 [Dyadobacter sp.]|uniref:hypothetical protein n=1 Tax=Dyadobacter sp. TaxID=1914288 RepID=UPI003265EAF0